MEFPSLGEQCFVENCHQLDFLPLKCQKCEAIFCSSHFQTSVHECTLETQTIDQPIQLSTSSKISCTFPKCKVKELLAVYCSQCQSFYCVGHRDTGDHKCEQIRTEKGINKAEIEAKNKRKAQAQELIDKVKSAPAAMQKPKTGLKTGLKTGAKMSPTIAKMLLKQKAKGDNKVPVAKRTYFKVILPLAMPETKAVPMFFSMDAPLGRVLDQIADINKVPNYNASLKPGQKRLALYDGKQGNHILVASNTINKLVGVDDWSDGPPTLILEYLDADSPSELNLGDYKDRLDI